MELIITGTVAFDAIETPFGKTDKIIGGAATYIGISASYFLKSVGVVAVVGEDFPQDYMDLLKSKNINLDGLQIKKGEKSFFWSGKYHLDLNSRDTLITELNVLADFDPIMPDTYQHSKYIMLGNLSPQVQMSMLQRHHKRPRFVALDTMNFWMDIALNELKGVLKNVDLLIINDEEARQLSGQYSLLKASKIIRDLGPKILIIKKGEHGALLFHADGVFSAPGLPLEEVFDPTGAGDTFAGGLMGYIASTDKTDFETLKKAVIYGSTMASFCVEKFGTERILNLSQEEIQSRYNQFVNLSQF